MFLYFLLLIFIIVIYKNRQKKEHFGQKIDCKWSKDPFAYAGVKAANIMRVRENGKVVCYLTTSGL